MARKLPSSVPFASLLAYSPKGKSEISIRSRLVRDGIKGGKLATLNQALVRLGELWQDAGMTDFFGPDVVLVPAPRSSPLVAGALWPSDLICKEILARGLAGRVEPSLERFKAVRKAAYQRAGERPTIEEHLESIRATPWLDEPDRITVVDDVITQGRMLFASCVLVQEAMPDAQVRAFGLLRTMGLVKEIKDIVDPAVGVLALDLWGEVDRDP